MYITYTQRSTKVGSQSERTMRGDAFLSLALSSTFMQFFQVKSISAEEKTMLQNYTHNNKKKVFPKLRFFGVCLCLILSHTNTHKHSSHKHTIIQSFLREREQRATARERDCVCSAPFPCLLPTYLNVFVCELFR